MFKIEKCFQIQFFSFSSMANFKIFTIITDLERKNEN